MSLEKNNNEKHAYHIYKVDRRKPPVLHYPHADFVASIGDSADIDAKSMLSADYVFTDLELCIFAWKNRFGPDGPISYALHNKYLAEYYKMSHVYTDLSEFK